MDVPASDVSPRGKNTTASTSCVFLSLDVRRATFLSLVLLSLQPSRRGLKQRQRYLESHRYDPYPYPQADRHAYQPRRSSLHLSEAAYPTSSQQAHSTTFSGAFYPSPSPPAPSPSQPFLHARSYLHTPISLTTSASPGPLDAYQFGHYVAEDLSFETWERSRREQVIRQEQLARSEEHTSELQSQ